MEISFPPNASSELSCTMVREGFN
ncbi:hypothetical protein NPIL_129521, partial [Nephila pilipes]